MPPSISTMDFSTPAHSSLQIVLKLNLRPRMDTINVYVQSSQSQNEQLQNTDDHAVGFQQNIVQPEPESQQSRNLFNLDELPDTETVSSTFFVLILQSIELNQLRVDEVPDLSRFTHLQFLGLRQNLLTSLNENLNALNNLVELELNDNQLTEIRGLDCLSNLEVLDLSYNRIAKIKGLSALTKLKRLFLVNNKISLIEGLENLLQLELLELGDNRIKQIENIGHLKQLEQLFIGKNKIRKIERIETLTKLRVLSLPGNRLIKLECLETFTELEELHISDQGIESLNGLYKQKKLVVLDAASNAITTLDNLDHLQELEDLWLNNNKIGSWAEVDKLAKLTSLQTVYLEHNPIYTEGVTQYRRKAMLALPQIKQLDATLCRK